MTDHHCHAVGCSTPVPARLFMCARHWRMVPPAFQRQIWRTYRDGQEIDKRPSESYLDATRVARRAVAVKESRLADFDREERATAAFAHAVVDAVALALGKEPPPDA